jgi:hypothetical protein
MNDSARKAGKKIGVVVTMSNVLTQDAKIWREYQELAGNSLYFNLVVGAPSPVFYGILQAAHSPSIVWHHGKRHRVVENDPTIGHSRDGEHVDSFE